MTRKQQIGFSQRIQFDWLEYTTNLVSCRELEKRNHRRSRRTAEGASIGRKRSGKGEPGQGHLDPDKGLGHGSRGVPIAP